jgi:diguanylate cyclase (GGDEF)-like protein
MDDELDYAALDPATLRQIEQLKETESYPVAKGPALALIRLTQRESTSLAVVAHALKADPTFSLRLIKVANGASGSEHRPVVSLRDAVSVLGVPAVRALALGFSLMSNHASGPCDEFDYPRFWSQSLARAVALQQLNTALKNTEAEEAFSVGLLARVGELALAELFPQPYADILKRRQQEPGLQLTDLEQQAFALSHGALTASMMLDCHLPREQVEAAQHFEDCETQNLPAGSVQFTARHLLLLADHVAGICVAPQAEWSRLMPRLFKLGVHLSLAADPLIATCDRVAHEWREWGAALEFETGPMPRFEECIAPAPDTPAPVVAAPAVAAVARPPVAAPAAAARAPAAAAPAVAATPRKPTEPLKPTAPAKPTEPLKPTAPAKPTEPLKPTAPVKPVAPVTPAAPVRSAWIEVGKAMSVLIVGDRERICNPLRDTLKAAGHSVVEAADGRQGLAAAIELQPQIMLVDLHAGIVDGIELTRTLRQFKAGRSTYVLILLTDAGGDENLIRGFEAGADDVITLPLPSDVLAAHLLAGQRVARLQEELARDQEEVRRISAELSATNQRLKEVGMTDMMTGCPNRSYAMDRIQQEWAMATRTQRPLACMTIEIDDFKRINDLRGHAAGDMVLKLVASALKDEMRAQDVLARTGGAEFFVICPDTPLDAAMACGERIRGVVDGLPISSGDQDVRASVSVGVAVRDASVADADGLIRLADQGAYLAKRNRNAVATVQSRTINLHPA